MVNEFEEALVRCKTTAGPFTLSLKRSLSPNGYDRAVELFERHFFDDSHFYRVVPKFLVQFGISYSKDQELQAFARQRIPDDPPRGVKFKKGTVSYAGNGDNSRTSQLFISYGSASSLGTQKWETPIGEVIEGMENVEKFYSYGDMPPWGKGPEQGKVHGHPEYIENNFPKIDKFIRCRTERLNTMKDDDDNKINNRIVKKEDHITDEENFAAAKEFVDSEKKAAAAAAARLNSPIKRKILDSQNNAGLQDVLIVLGIILAACTILRLRNQKKVTSKSN